MYASYVAEMSLGLTVHRKGLWFERVPFHHFGYSTTSRFLLPPQKCKEWQHSIVFTSLPCSAPICAVFRFDNAPASSLNRRLEFPKPCLERNAILHVCTKRFLIASYFRACISYFRFSVLSPGLPVEGWIVRHCDVAIPAVVFLVLGHRSMASG